MEIEIRKRFLCRFVKCLWIGVSYSTEGYDDDVELVIYLPFLFISILIKIK